MNLNFNTDFLRKLQNLYLQYKWKRDGLHISEKCSHEVLCTCKAQMASGISGNQMQRSQFLFPFSLYHLLLSQASLADGFHTAGMTAQNCQTWTVTYILQEVTEKERGKISYLEIIGMTKICVTNVHLSSLTHSTMLVQEMYLYLIWTYARQFEIKQFHVPLHRNENRRENFLIQS